MILDLSLLHRSTSFVIRAMRFRERNGATSTNQNQTSNRNRTSGRGRNSGGVNKRRSGSPTKTLRANSSSQSSGKTAVTPPPSANNSKPSIQQHGIVKNDQAAQTQTSTLSDEGQNMIITLLNSVWLALIVEKKNRKKKRPVACGATRRKI